MKINVKSLNNIAKENITCCFSFQDTSQKDKFLKKIVGLAKQDGFTGELRQTALLHISVPSISPRVIVAGLGKKKEISYEQIRIAVSSLIKHAESMKISSLNILLPGRNEIALEPKKLVVAITGAVILRSYRFNKYKTPQETDIKPLESVDIIVPDQKQATMVREEVIRETRIAEAVCFVRDLVNEQPSSKFPKALAVQAKGLAKPGRITVKVMEKAELIKKGMNALLGVSRGSHQPPVLIHLHYTPKKKSKKTIALVGKGITFDSGGLNLKPSNHIETMKLDMAGAATVLGIFKILPLLNLPVEIHGLLPCAENLPGGGAMKPSDVVKAYNGKTIEVLNTDAEGRLILADALSYGVTLKPDVMIDMATLTGAVQAAVGNLITGIMGTAQRTIDHIIRASEDSGEYFLQFPLFKAYDKQMKSHVADLKNIGAGKGGGAIIGGLFLKNFVKDIPWVHLDIAGTAWTDEELDYCSNGGTGVPLRSLVSWLTTMKA